MRDEFLGAAWADNHRLWAETIADALRWAANLPVPGRAGDPAIQTRQEARLHKAR
ncbi:MULTISPECIES: hypothetical protein [Sphingomonadales]|uniref:Uncharacterized protein n=1 Tax=Edaphosphingomonas haloaromaticamans TaxID=653954 RepID=A0A1S1H8C3_9SPHN|nr:MULTISPECIES: hypothetical protein [Sphingomonas]AGH50081.1 hypothetical protein G432_11800 [Sphingomonas sp. MM-1]OHT18439.1 hypothetical protein BHE75_00410 [Sphingomonas haloaromaticamans]